MPNLHLLPRRRAAVAPPPESARPAPQPVQAPQPVHVRGVTKSFGDQPVLRGADLALDAGRLVALLGPSGCGKTTLLRSIAGLETPDSGSVCIGDRVVLGPGVDVPAERRRVGMVFQDWALFPHLTVRANVGYGLRSRRDRQPAVTAALELVDLLALADRMPSTLSGGQQQRVALARALAVRPDVLLLDEPFSNLDATLRASIRSDVRDLLRRLGVTALFVTHDQEEAFVMGDEVAVMLGGRVVQQSQPASLYTAPATREVACFIGDANLLPGTAAGAVARTGVGAVPLRSDARGRVEVVVRPEQLRVAPGDQCVVERVEYYGHDAVYHVRGADGAAVRVRVIDTPRHAPGDAVDVSFDGDPTTAFALA